MRNLNWFATFDVTRIKTILVYWGDLTEKNKNAIKVWDSLYCKKLGRNKKRSQNNICFEGLLLFKPFDKGGETF